MDKPVLLEVKDLKTYFYSGKHALKAVDSVSFSIREGEVFGLVGESGSGKSITCKSLIGLIHRPGRIAGGSIRYRGQELAGLSEKALTAVRGKEIGMIFQEPMVALNPVLRIGQQITESFKDPGLSGEEKHARAVELLRRVGIPCIKVIGKTARGGAHCWCVAWIDGAPAHCDVTWEKADCGAVPFAHFNLTDEQIAADHFAFRSNGTPRCTKTGLDFYSQNGLFVKNAVQLARLFREQRTQNAPLRAGLWADPETLHAQIALALAMAGVTGGARYLCGKGLKNVLVERV